MAFYYVMSSLRRFPSTVTAQWSNYAVDWEISPLTTKYSRRQSISQPQTPAFLKATICAKNCTCVCVCVCVCVWGGGGGGVKSSVRVSAFNKAGYKKGTNTQ